MSGKPHVFLSQRSQDRSWQGTSANLLGNYIGQSLGQAIQQVHCKYDITKYITQMTSKIILHTWHLKVHCTQDVQEVHCNHDMQKKIEHMTSKNTLHTCHLKCPLHITYPKGTLHRWRPKSTLPRSIQKLHYIKKSTFHISQIFLFSLASPSEFHGRGVSPHLQEKTKIPHLGKIPWIPQLP